jgi:hypothetical protein
MKKKPIFLVTVATSFGLGIQPVKANSAVEAISKLKKRYKKINTIDSLEDLYPCNQNEVSSTILRSAI